MSQMYKEKTAIRNTWRNTKKTAQQPPDLPSPAALATKVTQWRRPPTRESLRGHSPTTPAPPPLLVWRGRKPVAPWVSSLGWGCQSPHWHGLGLRPLSLCASRVSRWPSDVPRMPLASPALPSDDHRPPGPPVPPPGLSVSSQPSATQPSPRPPLQVPPACCPSSLSSWGCPSAAP